MFEKELSLVQEARDRAIFLAESIKEHYDFLIGIKNLLDNKEIISLTDGNIVISFPEGNLFKDSSESITNIVRNKISMLEEEFSDLGLTTININYPAEKVQNVR